MDFKSLINSITTVFAWVPAGILLFLSLFGVVNVLVNWQQVSAVMFLLTCLVALGALSGFVALTAICWKVKLAPRLQLLGLTLGCVTLGSVIVAGAISGQEILLLSTHWIELYLFVSPLLLGSGHLVILLYQLRRNQVKRLSR